MKKNLVKKAVLPALAALLCSVIALTSVSYAWFTMGDTATVDGMSMQVTSAGGLQISATGDEGSFKSTLTQADLSGIQITDAKPVSTDGVITNGKLDFYTGTIVNGELAESAASATSNYISFDFYIKVTSANTLSLDAGSVVISNGKETHLASRVAFISLGSAQTAAEAKALVGTGVSGAAKIWEPNSTIRSTAVQNSGNTSNGQAVAYKGIADLDGTKPVISESNVTVFSPAQNGATGEKMLETTEAAELFALGAGYNKIRVYIWLEGQDVDCVNEVSGGTFTIKLNFKQNTLE